MTWSNHDISNYYPSQKLYQQNKRIRLAYWQPVCFGQHSPLKCYSNGVRIATVQLLSRALPSKHDLSNDHFYINCLYKIYLCLRTSIKYFRWKIVIMWRKNHLKQIGLDKQNIWFSSNLDLYSIRVLYWGTKYGMDSSKNPCLALSMLPSLLISFLNVFLGLM